jgi:hypothetical protein
MSNQTRPFNKLQEADKEPTKFKEFPIIKRAYAAYMDDVLNDEIPDVVLTPDCEKGYIMGYLSGCKEGGNMANEIHNEIFTAPTLAAYQKGTITDNEAKELLT